MAAKKAPAATKPAVNYVVSVDEEFDYGGRHAKPTKEGALKTSFDDGYDDDAVYYVYRVELVGKYKSKTIFEEAK